MGDTLERISMEKKKLSQYILGNARALMIALILFTVVVVTTTDINSITISSISGLGLEFFLILFASYAMYICCAEGGASAGMATDLYKDSVKRFSELENRLENLPYSRLNEFCAYYIAEDLKKARIHHLMVASIDYDEYLAKYVKLGKNELRMCEELTELQRKAILRANRVKQIRFTPDMMITMNGKSLFTRFGLTVTPRVQKKLAFGTKFIKMSFATLGIALIGFKLIIEPSWTVFAEVLMKLVTVVINGFDGRNTGYNNIVIDTVNYTSTQSNLMHQAIQYIDSHPANAATEAVV